MIPAARSMVVATLLLLGGIDAVAAPAWVQELIQTSRVTFAESPCTEKGGFGQEFGARRLGGGAQSMSKVAGTMLESEQFIYNDSRPPYSWFEVTRPLASGKAITVSAYIYFSTRELADQAHADLVRQVPKLLDIKAITPNSDANQTRLFTRPLVVKDDGYGYAQQGLMIDVEVVGTRMTIACTDAPLYVREVAVFPPAGFKAKEPGKYGLTAISAIDEPYCSRDMAFGVPFGSVPKGEDLEPAFSNRTLIRLSRAWPPFTEFEVTLTKDGRVTQISASATFTTHALAHQQALSIVKGIRDHVEIYDDTLDGLWPLLHTDRPYRFPPVNEYYAASKNYISGLAAVVQDSERDVWVQCTRRELRYPEYYEQYHSLRDEQLKNKK